MIYKFVTAVLVVLFVVGYYTFSSNKVTYKFNDVSITLEGNFYTKEINKSKLEQLTTLEELFYYSSLDISYRGRALTKSERNNLCRGNEILEELEQLGVESIEINMSTLKQ